jgi:two-component system, sensor histidine kinase
MNSQGLTLECTESESVCRILLVEDNQDAAAFLTFALEDHGHEIEHVRNGTEALVLAATYRPHIVLLDICLLGLDGHYVSRQLRQSHAEVFIIATTGQSRPEDFERSKASGCDYHLVKPLDLTHVIELVEKWKARGGCKAKA